MGEGAIRRASGPNSKRRGSAPDESIRRDSVYMLHSEACGKNQPSQTGLKPIFE